MRVALFGSVVGLLAFTSPALAEQWVRGANVSCVDVCRDAKLKAITSGNHTNGHPFTICRDFDTGRPGWNLRPSWRNKCFVAIGGKEVGVVKYDCLCQ
jgi:hypothetical protein